MWREFCISLALICIYQQQRFVHALDNGLALTPPMGSDGNEICTFLVVVFILFSFTFNRMDVMATLSVHC